MSIRHEDVRVYYGYGALESGFSTIISQCKMVPAFKKFNVVSVCFMKNGLIIKASWKL